MEFCVLIKISKQKVSFWYQTGTSPYVPLILKDSNEVPLYFYVDGTDFIFGDNIAVDRFYSNDPNAYGNYFEIIKDPSSHFTIAGNKKPVKQLLYHGVEKNLNFFINQVLYKNDSLESYRQNFPLRFWFEPDIEEKEKALIENLFIGAGYDNIERIDYNLSLFQALSSDSILNINSTVLILSGISNTLYMELYKNISEPLTSSSKLEGHGADPSVRILSEMIVEDILMQESYLSVNTDKEVAALLTYSAERLENITPIIKGYAVLTDGKKHYFEVKQRLLNERLLYTANDSIVYAAISDLLSSHSVNCQDVTLLLGTKDINTTYLINKLLVKFPNVKGVEKKHSLEALKLVFFRIAQAGYLPRKRPSIIDQTISTPLVPNRTVPPLPPVVNNKHMTPPPPVMKNNTSAPPPIVKRPMAPPPHSSAEFKSSIPPLPPLVNKSVTPLTPPPPVIKKPTLPPPPPPVIKKSNLPPPPPLRK